MSPGMRRAGLTGVVFEATGGLWGARCALDSLLSHPGDNPPIFPVSPMSDLQLTVLVALLASARTHGVPSGVPRALAELKDEDICHPFQHRDPASPVT